MKTQQEIKEMKEAMKPFWDNIGAKAKRNEETDKRLQAFCLEPCDIHTYERKPINEHCDFIRFTFDGNECIAVEWDDGVVYTPTDWQASWEHFDPFKNEDDDLAAIDWMDCNMSRAIMINGLPHSLITH